MKYIKIFESFTTEQELERYGIKNYTINPDGTVDVNSDVDLCNNNLDKIPIRFGKVSGYFDCSYNNLTSLEGCPSEVSKYFICGYNKLTNLVGGPIEVKSTYDCKNNELTSLEGIASEIGKHLIVTNNKLKDLDISSIIGGDIYCYKNEISSKNYNFYGELGGVIKFKQ